MRNPHSQPLLDAFRAWHRWEHGDQVGALAEARHGVEVPEEWREVFEAQADLVAAYENAEDAAEQFGHDSEEFQHAAELWTVAVQRLAEVMDQSEPEPEPARGRQGRGPGQGQNPQKAAAQKAAGMARQTGAIGPATTQTNAPGPGGVVTGGQSLGHGVTMGAIDAATVRGLPPPMSRGGS